MQTFRDCQEVARRMSFALLAAESPEARIEETDLNGTPKSHERGKNLRSDWQAASNLLRLASAINAVGVSASNLDPWRSDIHCESATEFNEIHELLLRDYFSGLSRFQLIWNAYELVRNSSRIGQHLMAQVPQNLEGNLAPICSLDYFPLLRRAWERLDRTWGPSEKPRRLSGFG
jgi:hypothetical protein